MDIKNNDKMYFAVKGIGALGEGALEKFKPQTWNNEYLEISTVKCDLSDESKYADILFVITDCEKPSDLELAIKCAEEYRMKNKECITICITHENKSVSFDLKKCFNHVVFVENAEMLCNPIEMVASSFGYSDIGIDYFDIIDPILSHVFSFAVSENCDGDGMEKMILDVCDSALEKYKEYDCCDCFVYVSANPKMYNGSLIEDADSIISELDERLGRINIAASAVCNDGQAEAVVVSVYCFASSYSYESKNLFDEWKKRKGEVSVPTKNGNVNAEIDHSDGTFIFDGVVCPKKWFDSDIRPMYLLKEAYGGGERDLISGQLGKNKKIGKSQMWKRVSKWTYGLLKTTKTGIAPYIRSNDEFSYYNNIYLQQSAVVNVKKSGGNRNSDFDNVMAYAEFDRENLRRQIEICDPTVIICGYTASALATIFDIDRSGEDENQFFKFRLNNHDVIVLDYWHPANHFPDIMNYYGLMGIYQRALNSN